jgi:hypothetical protein
MKYYIDTHDVKDGTFPEGVTEEQFIEVYSKFDDACHAVGGTAMGAHVNVQEGKAYCFTKNADKESLLKAHAAIGLKVSEVTEIKRVTGVDLR